MTLRRIAATTDIDFAPMTALIVEDNISMRGTLKTMLGSFGLVQIEFAQRAAEARKKITSREFNVVLCDFMLDLDGMTGQELLEELRVTHLLPLESIFIMITAERVYERVVATAEYGPDDYIIKPFSADVLRLRLTRAIERKIAMTELNALLKQRDSAEAVLACDRGLKHSPKFALDFLRMKAELLTTLHRPDEAQKIYEDILKHKAVPWAHFGMAVILAGSERLAEAETALSTLIAENPLFMRAYDQLAKVQSAKGDTASAQVTLQKAADKSASMGRIAQIGELARQNGDLITAEIMLTKAVSRVGISDMVNPDHVLALASIKSELGKEDEALAVIATARKSMPSGSMSITAYIVEARIFAERGNVDVARKSLDLAIQKLTEDEMTISSELAPELLTACLLTNHPDTFALARSILEQHTDERLREKLQKLFLKHGYPDIFASAAKEALAVVTQTNNEGVQAASRREFGRAIALMTDAYQRMPGNAKVAINLAKILVAGLEFEPFTPTRASQAEDILVKLFSLPDKDTREEVQRIKQKLAQLINNNRT